MQSLLIILAIIAGIFVLLGINKLIEMSTVKKFRQRLARNFGTFKRIDSDDDKIRKVRGYFFRHLDDDGFY